VTEVIDSVSVVVAAAVVFVIMAAVSALINESQVIGLI
jgi:hypothetical protein